ncbi:hypothetical protein PK98_02525 [Croceibacterium mercuriale]|uniref:Uncharacterized protein n=1 Tax=Croceibacterium mercuriale TaxID=1572751 RepID=A0A0B2BVT8_9SPHN|nr:hypothetical protein [Croceibacterium mercuriale]KHL25564.1 hypothetical protein PK98_02525 [Croceibacterium mercuriale]
MSHDLLLALTALSALLVIAAAALKGWQGWLALKTRELDLRRAGPAESGSREGAARIEMADLRERIRQLEAIASGVDL